MGCAGSGCPGPWRGARDSLPATLAAALLRSPQLTPRVRSAYARLHGDRGLAVVQGQGGGGGQQGTLETLNPGKVQGLYRPTTPGKGEERGVAARPSPPRLGDPGEDAGGRELPGASRIPLHPATLWPGGRSRRPRPRKAGVRRVSRLYAPAWDPSLLQVPSTLSLAADPLPGQAVQSWPGRSPTQV